MPDDPWAYLSGLAIAALVYFFFGGQSAVWGGATCGAAIGLIIAGVIAFTGSDFTWLIVWKGAVIGALSGLASEILAWLGVVLRRKQ
jgi:hypothetical protein